MKVGEENIEDCSKAQHNACLLKYYQDGGEYISYHSDKK